MPAVRQTDEQRRLDEVHTRVSGLEAQVVAIDTQVRVHGERLAGYIESGQAHRERIASEQGEIRAGLSRTEVLIQQQIDDARAEREACRRMAEAEAAHVRAMQTAAVAGRGEVVRAVLAHPAVTTLAGAIAAGMTAWAYATWGGPVPGHTVTGQAAATGVMTAGVD